jgi:hypothetical protein
MNFALRIPVKIVAVMVWLFFALAQAKGGSPSGALEIPFQFREGLIWLQVSVAPSAQRLTFICPDCWARRCSRASRS